MFFRKRKIELSIMFIEGYIVNALGIPRNWMFSFQSEEKEKTWSLQLQGKQRHCFH